ncbi:MAG: MBL fold metallo-hydrolase [Nitrososphaerales archaeon]
MLVEVGEDVFCCVAESDDILDGWGANQGFLITESGVVVNDTGFTRFSTNRLLDDIRSQTNQPIVLVINTHDHSDHVFGNHIFAQMKVPILSHRRCNDNLKRFGEERMRTYRDQDSDLRAALEGLKISPASFTYSSAFTLEVGDKTLEIIHPEGGAHTYGDTMIYLPEDKILFAGDVLWAGYHPNLEDANLKGWITWLERISSMKVEKIVPGHGAPTGKESVSELSRYLLQFEAWLDSNMHHGIPERSTVSGFHVDGTDNWKLKMLVQRNIELLYKRSH